jgi:hypothetical protein
MKTTEILLRTSDRYFRLSAIIWPGEFALSSTQLPRDNFLGNPGLEHGAKIKKSFA